MMPQEKEKREVMGDDPSEWEAWQMYRTVANADEADQENEENQVQEMSLLGDVIIILLLWYIITNLDGVKAWSERSHMWKSAKRFVREQMKRWSKRRRDLLVKENTVLELDLEFVRISDRRQRVSAVLGQSMWQPIRVLWYRTLVNALDAASRDDKVRAVVVRLGEESVGHVGVTVIEELRDALARFRKQGKVAIVHAETIGELSNGTKAFMLASAFDAIMVANTGLICTPGLSMSSFFVKNLLQKLNIDAEMFSRDERYKTFPNTFTKDKMPKEQREEMEKLLSGLSELVASDIASSRNVDVSRVNQWLDTAMWFADDAQSSGMIDSTYIHGRDDARKEIFKRLTLSKEDANFLYLQRYMSVNKGSMDIHNWSPGVSNKSKSKNNSVALIHLHGQVMRGEQAVSSHDESEGIYSENISRLIRSIRTEGKIKTVVLRINSGGGSGTAANIITREIDLARSSGIKFYAQVGDLCASAAYQIAMHCDHITANRGSITGSIGVIVGKFNVGGALEQMGVHVDSINSHENSDLFSITKALTEQQEKTLKGTLDKVYKQFVDDAAKCRNMTEEQVNKVAGGRVFLGDEAKKLGLIDEIGTLNDTLNMVARDLGLGEKGVLRINMLPKDSFFVKLFSRPKNDDEKDKLFLKSATVPYLASNDVLGNIGHLSRLGQYARRANDLLDRTVGRHSNVHSLSAFFHGRHPPGSTRQYGTRMLMRAMKFAALKR